jgi:hypothetical protein
MSSLIALSWYWCGDQDFNGLFIVIAKVDIQPVILELLDYVLLHWGHPATRAFELHEDYAPTGEDEHTVRNTPSGGRSQLDTHATISLYPLNDLVLKFFL